MFDVFPRFRGFDARIFISGRSLLGERAGVGERFLQSHFRSRWGHEPKTGSAGILPAGSAGILGSTRRQGCRPNGHAGMRAPPRSTGGMRLARRNPCGFFMTAKGSVPHNRMFMISLGGADSWPDNHSPPSSAVAQSSSRSWSFRGAAGGLSSASHGRLCAAAPAPSLPTSVASIPPR